MAKDLQYYFAQLRRIEETREKTAEKEIRKIYKDMLKDLQHFIADEYVKLADEGKLTYEILRGKGEYARFLEEVEQRLNKISPKVSKEIKTAVEEIYKLSYDGMVDAVRKSASTDELRAALHGVSSVTPETIKAAVENPVAGLTLADTLEKNRREIIYNIKRQIGIGLTVGDRMTTMAKRISESLDGDYKKAVRIARTEVHRVREAGHLESCIEIQDTLEQGVSGMEMHKIWRTMQDERVRPNKRYRTKKGWKTTRGSGPDHQKMDGQEVPVKEKFDLGGGVTAMAPGQSGVAGHDINCRCTVIYKLREKAKTSAGKVEQATADDFNTVSTSKELENFKSLSAEEQYAQLWQWHSDSSLEDALDDMGMRGESITQVASYKLNNNTKPLVLKADDFDDYVKTSRSEILYRGTTPVTKRVNGESVVVKTAKEINDYTKYGEFTWIGKGTYGDGIYFSNKSETAVQYSNKYGAGSVMEAVLKPNAKGISFADLRELYAKSSAEAERCEDADAAAFGKWLYFNNGDPYGAVALINGYDYVTVERPNGELYIAVVNRGALIVKE